MRALLSILVLSLVSIAGCGDPGPVATDAGLDSSTPPSPCADSPCPPGELCVEEADSFRCDCPAGSERVDGTCTPSTTCEPNTCDGHGACSMDAGTISCACDTGYSGDRCEACDAGYLRNHLGACVTNLCEPSPCEDPDRMRCEVIDGAAVCQCSAGTHDEGGICVPDTTCTATTCSGRGTCEMTAEGMVGCVCDAGATGRFCDACDVGWHEDGAGGCTMDPCTPSPCTAALETVCVAESGAARCECDAGAHREGALCVIDEVCASDTCGSGGTCSVVMGVTACTCAAGWVGTRCDACDIGYHDDGAGGCTTDPCLPSPCTMPNRGVCTASGATATCGCDAGYHEDGAGGCTTDPCTPNPCLASGQACRVTSGAAECYTPVCDDGNPCTTDALVAGSCSYTPLANGSSCATSLCLTGQTCTAGACGGGSAVTCDDGNPCTRDACSPTRGCGYTADDTLIPDDGIACTVDTCSSGAASHTASDARCDDGLFCDGAERCAPGTSGAGADGCVAGTPPSPPGPSTPCRSYAGCDEATDSFPRTDLPTGASCDDGLSCTTGDVCRASGVCTGTALATCPASGGSCASTTPLGSSIDVGVARVTGRVTLEGASLPANLAIPYSGGFDLFLVSRETEQRHYLARPSYSGSTSALASGSDLVSATLVPGVYDLVYDRGHDDGSDSYWSYVSRQSIPSELPNGYVVLQRGIVLGAGTQTLDVDVPVTRVSGAITLGGAPLPANLAIPYSGGFDLFLVSRDTGERHYLARPSYSGSTSALAAGSNVVRAVLVPGAYDLVYDRGHDDGSLTYWPYVSRQSAPSELPNGYVVLRENVVLAPGAQTLDVDVPVTTLSGAITLGGAPLPANLAVPYSGGFDLFLVSRATGQRHYIARPSYSGSTSALAAGSDHVDAVLVPGTYDVVYDRGHDDGSDSYWPYVSRQPIPGELPNGYVVLASGVTLAAGAQTLNVDVPVSRVTGAVTLGGAPLPPALAIPYSGGFDLFLVSRTTGQRHYLARPSYSGSTSALAAGSDQIGAVLVPGTYDIVYDRGHDDGSLTYWPYVSRQTAPSELPNGYVVLREDVVIAAGEQTLDVDVPVTRLTGAITLDGAPLPAHLAIPYSGGFDLFLVSRSTGQRHYLARPSYSGSTSALATGSDRVDAVLVPGTYDLVYDRGHDDGSDSYWSYVSRQSIPSELPNGYVVLASGITIAAGDQTRNVDIPRVALSQPITLEGLPLPARLAVPYSGGFDLFLVSRTTGERHYVARPSYSGSTSALAAGSDRLSAVVVPGVYDLLYDRGHDDGSLTYWPYVSRQQLPSELPNGYVLLRSCILVE